MRHEAAVDGEAAVSLEFKIEAIALDEGEDAVDIGIIRERHVGVDARDGEAPAEIFDTRRIGCNVP